jgi:4-oxalocrotonate tautomerase
LRVAEGSDHTAAHTVGADADLVRRVWDPTGGSTTEESRMPFINVKVIENVFTDGQKHQIVERLTDAMVAIDGEPMRGVTWVVIEEVKSGDWAIGGKALTTEAVLELAAGAPVD